MNRNQFLKLGLAIPFMKPRLQMPEPPTVLPWVEARVGKTWTIKVTSYNVPIKWAVGICDPYGDIIFEETPIGLEIRDFIKGQIWTADIKHSNQSDGAWFRVLPDELPSPYYWAWINKDNVNIL